MLFKIILIAAFHFTVGFIDTAVVANPVESKKNYTSIHQEAKAFCKKQQFDESYYFLVDLSLHSGKNRFFIYDFNQKKVVNHNLVTHGSCDGLSANDSKWEKATCSNANDSHCSAKGKYKIGRRDASSWGIKVKYCLHGMESSNSNAEKRVVVLHSWTAVANQEIYPRYSPLSWGCPAVSDAFMELLDEKLQQSKKPVLLWIID